MQDVIEHLDRVREAQIELAKFRRTVLSEISARQRKLEKHEADVRALRTDGQLEMGMERINLRPDFQELLEDPTSHIGVS